MRSLGIALFVCLATCGVSTVWAQYGMYGSPDVLPVQQTTKQVNQYPASTAQPVAWTAPVEQPAIVPSAPMPAPSGLSQPSQGYVQPQGGSMVNQMLAEQGNGCVGGCNDNCGQSVCNNTVVFFSAMHSKCNNWNYITD